MGTAATMLAGRNALSLLHGSPNDKYPKSLTSIFQQPKSLHNYLASLPDRINRIMANTSMFFTSIFASILYLDQCLRRYGKHKCSTRELFNNIKPSIFHSDNKDSINMLTNTIAFSGAITQSILYYDNINKFTMTAWPIFYSLHATTVTIGCALCAATLFMMWIAVYENAYKDLKSKGITRDNTINPKKTLAFPIRSNNFTRQLRLTIQGSYRERRDPSDRPTRQAQTMP